MKKETPPPRANVLEAVPELAVRVLSTIRLHPRRGEVADPAGSKLGGHFLWPSDEEWPTLPSKRPSWWEWDDGFTFPWNIPDGTSIHLVPVLQLNKQDVPDFLFLPGMDLLQLLWLPLNVEDAPYMCVPRGYWRNSQTISSHLSQMPLSPYADPHYISHPCQFSFETVQEYPGGEELPDEIRERIDAWEETLALDLFESDHPRHEENYEPTLYDYELSVCPGSKLGGHVNWLQRPEWPSCVCGQQMEHLLTLSNHEFDGGTWPRWCPLEDRPLWEAGWPTSQIAQNAPGWSLGGGRMFYFVCRHCDGWPIQVVYQR